MKSPLWTFRFETRVQEALSHIRHKAKQEAEDAMKLKVLEKEEQIASMQRQLEELDLLFQYLTGPRFRQRIEAIVEKFPSCKPTSKGSGRR